MDNTTKQLYKEFTKEFKADIIEYDVENESDLKEFLEFIKNISRISTKVSIKVEKLN